MRIVFFGLFLMISCNSLCGQDWDLKKEVEGIKAYHQEVNSTKFKRYKIETEIKGTLESLVAILQDIDIYTDIFSDLRDAELIKSKDQNHLELLLRTKTPFPVKDRFSYSQTLYSYDTARKSVIIDIECLDNSVLDSYGDKGILITDCNGSWKLTDLGNGKIYVEHEFYADPGGIVPAWIVNKRTIDSPIKTIKAIRKLVKKSKYQNLTFDFIKE